jgi:tetratricopeptide (TPR) repeat protein
LAGDQAEAVFAHDEAERQYRTALDLACELGDAQREAGVLEKLGAVLTTRAKYDEALKLLDRAAQLQRAAGDLGAVGRVTARIGRAHFLQGTPQEGVARLEPVLELLEESEPSHSLAALYVAQASLLFGSERWSEAEEAARQASTLARAMGDERILVEALTARGEALLNQLAFEEALQVLEEAVALAERLDDLHSLTHALSGIGGVHGLRGDNALARPNFERALAVARRLGDPTRIAFLSANCAGTAIAFGDWEQARAHAEEAAEIIRVVGPSREAPYCLTTLAVVRLEQEGGDAAYRFMEECIELSERARDIQQVLRGHTLLAQHDLLAGRSEAALTRLQAPAHRVEAQWRFTLGFWLTLARAHLALGNRREAEKLLAEILTGISSVSALAVAQAHIVLAMLRTQQEAWQEAESLFDAALSSFQEKKVPFAEGHARYEWGIMYLRKGEPEKARHQLKAALAIFQRLGARSYSERTEHILSQL